MLAIRREDDPLPIRRERAFGVVCIIVRDRALRESCDYATGASGIAMFLNRLISVALPGDEGGDVRNFNFTLDDFCFFARGKSL